LNTKRQQTQRSAHTFFAAARLGFGAAAATVVVGGGIGPVVVWELEGVGEEELEVTASVTGTDVEEERTGIEDGDIVL